jgi:hypothetical protein
MRPLNGSGELHPDDLFGHALAAGECAETAETPGNTGLTDARLFVIAHVNTGFDLFADHMAAAISTSPAHPAVSIGCRLPVDQQV